MPLKQNPTAKGRVLWNSLAGASADTLTLFAYRAQHLIVEYGVRPEPAAILAALVSGGSDHV